MEIWQPVKTYEGKYEVSNLGNVRSIDRVERFMNSTRLRKGMIISSRYLAKYKTVHLKDYGRNKTALIHRLVAESFIGDVTGKVVDHIDFNPDNNCVENLQIITQYENIRRSVNAKRHNHGETHGMSKLKENDIIRLRECKKGFISELCKELNIGYAHAKKVRAGKLWKEVKLQP